MWPGDVRGQRGVWQGAHACVAGGVRGRGHVWQEVCVVWECAWLGGMCGHGGMHGRGACMAGGMCGRETYMAVGMHGWGAYVTHTPAPLYPPAQILRLRHKVNERAVRILLECILVGYCE